ncbi:hypothetical protein FGO68_gene480 [Halteria grandinella]|uniref:Uncharacterized protein n=1 Tax=Halteria grandinella TaxID=5974 RepID=A0A8J8P1D1_HALGN|nr:hypothetical protein FGO68_gene480 [Halteria grandinella]
MKKQASSLGRVSEVLCSIKIYLEWKKSQSSQVRPIVKETKSLGEYAFQMRHSCQGCWWQNNPENVAESCPVHLSRPVFREVKRRRQCLNLQQTISSPTDGNVDGSTPCYYFPSNYWIVFCSDIALQLDGVKIPGPQCESRRPLFNDCS